MKAIRTIFAAAVSILTVAACTFDEPALIEPSAPEAEDTREPLVFTATLDGTETKTLADLTSGKVRWETRDQIAINSSRFAATPHPNNGSKATFNMLDGETIPSGPFTAFYPSILCGGKLPATWNYADNFGMPMYAQSDNTTLGFKNICAVFAITVTQTNFQSIRSITVTSDNHAMSGAFTVVNDKAVISNEDLTKGVTLNFKEAEAIAAGEQGSTFCLPVPAQTYSRIKVRISGTNSNGENITLYMATREGNDITVECNTIYPLPFYNNYTPAAAEKEAEISLSNRVWGKTTPVREGDALTTGTPQGAAYYNGKIYQFKVNNTEKYNSYDTYNIARRTWSTGEVTKIGNSENHVGSATFGKKIWTKADGYAYDCTKPFVFLTGHFEVNGAMKEVISVVDIDNKALVANLTFPDLPDDAIAAYDFENNKVWMVGYETKTGIAPWLIREFDVPLDVCEYTTTDFTTIASEVIVGGPNASGIQENLNCGTVQDVYYQGGKLFFLTGRGSASNRTEWIKIHSFDTNTKELGDAYVLPCSTEGQGFVYDYDNDVFYVTDGSCTVWDFPLGSISSNGSGELYNFEPADEVVPGTYSIKNGSQLVWFLGQVYGGCTTINAELANDIDMTGITDPFCSYVYDTSSPRKFDAQYAFRGTFDGKGHTINGLHISSTPYDNVGLFPYVLGGTIKNVSVNGYISLSTAVDNVGFIGYMDGGEISNVNVIDFTIDKNGQSPAHSNPLCGNLSNVTPSDCIIAQDHSEGHQYINGFCKAIGDCTVKYEAAEEVGGVYQITNGGNLFWFAEKVNAGNPSLNAILVNDINIEGNNYPWTPIGKTSSLVYSGTFNGNGKTISNFALEMNSGYRSGLFGTTTNATIKNFTINGHMSLASNDNDKFFNGAVVGQAGGTTTITDVISNVNITVGSKCRGIGGIVGCAIDNTNTVINRCTYGGVITVTGSYPSDTYPVSTGGIVGDLRKGKVTNCLFIGKIVSTVSSSDGDVNIAGIAGNNANSGNTVSNCLVNGSFSILDNSNNHCAYVIGWNKGNVNGSSNFYTAQNTAVATGSLSGVGANTFTAAAPAVVNNLAELTNGDLLISLGETDWIQGTSCPIPLIGGNGVHNHKYTSNGFCLANDGTFEQPELQGGYYLIDNAGKLYWFAKYVNTIGGEGEGNGAAKAKLTSDINMTVDVPGASIAFPGIGRYKTKSDNSQDLTYSFTGTFDGQGHTISNFANNVTSGGYHGLINDANGATIKDFTIEGQMTINISGNAQPFQGSVLGRGVNVTIEDVTSSVDITVTQGARHYGGLVGRASGTINRCRYSGTITAGASYEVIGGVIGSADSGVKVNNTLFDGEIITTSSNSALVVGGLLGNSQNANNELNNCLVHGTISISNNTATTCGIVIGTPSSGAKINNTYYTTTNVSEGLAVIGTGNGSSKVIGTAQEATDLTSLAESLGTANWQQGASYPIPQKQN